MSCMWQKQAQALKVSLYVGVGANPISDNAFWLRLMCQKQVQAYMVFWSTCVALCTDRTSDHAFWLHWM